MMSFPTPSSSLGALIARAFVFISCVIFGVGCALPPDDESVGHGHSHSHVDEDALVTIQQPVNCAETADVGYVRGTPYQIKLIEIDGKPVEKDTGNAYWVMQQAAAADGVTIRIVSGFRTQSEQQYLYNCYRNCNCNNCNLAARPGYSNHQSGHALDLNTSSPGVYNWLSANAGRFGFKRTVPSEKWHWEWWGGGPGGGICGVCEPSCKNDRIIIDSNCNEGDCGAYGSRCVDDNLGARCAFFACPDQGELDVCLDEKTIVHCKDGALESQGDCSAFFGACSSPAGLPTKCRSLYCVSGDDKDEVPVAKSGCDLGGNIFSCDAGGDVSVQECPNGQKCSVYPELGCKAHNGCPAEGQAEVCVDEHLIGKCFAGGLYEIAQDCSNQNAYCSTAGGSAPRCHSVHCVRDADEIPSEHDVCLPTGDIGHCAADGTVETEVCPDGTACVDAAGNVSCEASSQPNNQDTPTPDDMGGSSEEMGQPANQDSGNNASANETSSQTTSPGASNENNSTGSTTTGRGSCQVVVSGAGSPPGDPAPLGVVLLLVGGLCARRRW